ncbi:hypothetical protein AGMMS49949_08250 [Alphaproteobacteria bacterium]|nr:hypothetical protein AGMMS49949_08250 [Alphaproteobacteria bacterium]GHS99324.1 hypothetical protein AGMMS50296_7420 [Alphaproteobacteria bacterium]
MRFTECSIDQLAEKAYLLTRRITEPACIFLWGAMGAGKTTFARSFIRSYFADPSLYVPSPTFTLIQAYAAPTKKQNSPKYEIWHVDLYRIKNLDEVLDLGLEEALYHQICLVEWPDRIEGLFIPNRINVYLNFMSETTRAFAILFE